MGEILLYADKNFKAVSERPKGAGNSLSPPPGANRDPTPSGTSFPICTISNRIQVGDLNLWPSEEAAVTGSGSGQLLRSRPRNRPHEKVDQYGRGDLD